MAYIVNTTDTDAVSAASYTVTLGAHQAGDLLLVFLTQDVGGTAIAPDAAATTAGWAILVQERSGTSVRHAVAYLVASGSSTTNPTFTGANDDWLGTCCVVRDVSASPFGTLVDGTDFNSTAYTAATSYVAGALTPAVADCLVFYSFGKDGSGAANFLKGKINDTRCVSKATNTAICQTVSVLQHPTATAVPTPTFYSTNSVTSTGIVCAVRNATNGVLQPDIRPNVTELYWYGGSGAVYDPAVSWQAPDQFAASLGTYLGSAINCSSTAPTVSTTGVTGFPANWGQTTGFLVTTNASLQEAGAGAGIWSGGTHTISSTNLDGKIVGIEVFKNSTSGDALLGPYGIVIAFSDGTNWAAFQVMNKFNGYINNYAAPMRMFYVACGSGASTPLFSSGTINWGAVTRVGYFYHRISSSTASYGFAIRNLLVFDDPVPLTGGGDSRPALSSDFTAINGWGAFDIINKQAGSQVMPNVPIQIGDGGTNKTYFDSSASSIEFPLAYGYTANDQVSWNAKALTTELRVKAGSSDTINLAAGVCATDVQQNLTIDAASSTDATYSFAGTSFVGWSPTWKTGVNVSSATFKECDEIDAKGSDWTDCSISKTTSTDAAIAFSEDGGSMTRCTIDVTGTSAAYHLELGTAVTAITMADVTFTGTPGTDKVHVRATTGTVTITTSGTTSLVAGDVTSEGATVSIVAPTVERGQEFTGLTAGSFVRVVTSDNLTQKFEDLNSSTTETWDDATVGTISVDYSIMKAGLVPIRVAGVSLTGIVGTGVITTPVDQIEDRGYAAASGLTINTNVYGTVGTKKFGLTTGSTTQNFYSYFIEQWIALGNTGEAYANTDFPMESTGPTSFTMKDGWQFDLTTYPNSIANLSRGGLRYLNASGAVTDVWAAILTAGVPASLTVRYKHASTGAWSSASAADDMDELIKIIEDPNGDGSYVDGFDRSGTMIVRVQGEGYDMAEVDVVGTFGTLSNYLYAIAPVPLANGVTTGNPTLNGSPAISVGTYTYSGLNFGIKIVDGVGGNSAENLMRWIRYAQGQGGAFQGREANDWHDLIQTNGDSFKTVRGTIYGPTAVKGVIVYQSDGTTLHSGFNLFTSDDGTTYSPPVTANVSISGLVNAGAVPTRLQIINTTALSASAWVANTAYATGDLVLRTSGIGTENTAGLYFRATTGGTSHAVTEPTWNTTPGGTTSDGTVTWTTYKVLFYDDDPASTAYSDSYIDGEEFAAGESVEVRFAEMNGATSFKTAHSTAITSSTGFSIAMAIESDSVYATNALNGADYEATFSPNFTSDYIVLDSNTDFAGKAAYAYFCYTLTSSNGMYQFWDGVTALDEGNYRINVDVLNLYFDESAGFVKQTDDVRIFRSDGTRPALDPTTGGAGIEINWRVPVNVVTTGGSALTPTESAYLLALPIATDNASAVRTELTTELARIDATVSSRLASASYTAPDNASIADVKTKTDQLQFNSGKVHSDAKAMNGATITGTGTANDKWRGV